MGSEGLEPGTSCSNAALQRFASNSYMLAKPCSGAFSEAVLQSLLVNTDRSQWTTHLCELCSKQVGARLYAGKWSPEQHWHSVTYLASNRRGTRMHKSGRIVQ